MMRKKDYDREWKVFEYDAGTKKVSDPRADVVTTTGERNTILRLLPVELAKRIVKDHNGALEN